jgi:hypothetical protein
MEISDVVSHPENTDQPDASGGLLIDPEFLASLGSTSSHGLGGLVLGILEAEELLLVVEGDLDGPPASIALEDEGVVNGQVGAEECLVAAATAGISDDDDADRLRAQRAVPEGGTAEDQRGDLTAVEGDGQRIPAPPSGPADSPSVAPATCV